MRRIAACLAVLALCLCPAAASADDLIVRFDPGTSESQRTAARTLAGVTKAEPLPLDGMEVVSTGPGAVVGDVVRRLEALDTVLYAEPDAPIGRHAVPDDPIYAQQWAHPLIGTPTAWDTTTGAPGVVVAVVDSGADLGHPDLRPNLWRNTGEVAGNDRDDDGNGYVDDVHGYDFQQRDGTPSDADGHGSHVAGIVGARGNDGVGVAGVAWRASLLPLRVLDRDGRGKVSDAIRAYAYARRAGARVVNVSWGGSRLTRAERDAIADASNVLFVTSAGNDGGDDDAVPTYPCAHDLPNVVCVGASGRDDALASFSNRGAKTVDLAAPGVGIASTVPGPNWALEDGTSMAAPHVAGAAALMLSRAPGTKAPDLRSALLGTVDRRPALAGVTVTGGRLNVAAAVQAVGGTSGSASSRSAPRADRARPAVRIVSAARERRGVRARVRCSEACALRVEVVTRRGGRSVVVGRGSGRRTAAGTTTVRVTLTRRQHRALRRGSRVRARATDAAGNVGRASRAVRLRR